MVNNQDFNLRLASFQFEAERVLHVREDRCPIAQGPFRLVGACPRIQVGHLQSEIKRSVESGHIQYGTSNGRHSRQEVSQVLHGEIFEFETALTEKHGLLAAVLSAFEFWPTLADGQRVYRELFL